MAEWDTFEQVLLAEFRSILSNFKCIETVLTSDTRKDFMGLLHFILNDRATFRAVALNEFGIEWTTTTATVTTDSEGFDPEEFLRSILNSSADRLPSFSPEFSKFPLLLAGDTTPLALELCERYWSFRYPSIKESFIIPFASRFPPPPSSTLARLLKGRLVKGKLVPFDDSLLLARKMDLVPSDLIDGYFDHQLAALKGILSNNSQAEAELRCVLQQSGCHCD